MRVRLAVLAIAGLGMGTLGCDVGSAINFDGFGSGSGCGSPESPQCQAITVTPASVLVLLGDTVGLLASNAAKQTDFTWESPLASIAQAGQPTVKTEWFGTFSRVVVTANGTGTATIVARRKNYSVSATITVIPPSSIGSLIIKKNRCLSGSAASCEPVFPSGAPDTVHVGDTITVAGWVRDVDGHDVVATVNWTSTNPSAVEPTVARDVFGSVQAVAAKSLGTAVIRGTVAGLSQLFVVNVVK